MDIQLLYLDGCPHVAATEARLNSALAIIGRADEPIRRVLVETFEDAERLRFVGSPTVLVDGGDPFATEHKQPALACRMFSTPDGLAGSPTLEQLIQVLSGDRG